MTYNGGLGVFPNTFLKFSLTQKNYSSETSQPDINSRSISAVVNQTINRRIKINGSLGVFQFPGEETLKNTFDVDVWANIWVNKDYKSTISFNTEIQDFNQSLAMQNLSSRHLSVKNSFFWKSSDIGWFHEYDYSFYTDNNRRFLTFQSFYKKFQNIRFLKVGFNYLNLSFRTEKPLLYFSPKKLHQVETFTSMEFSISKRNSTKILADMAIGHQWSGSTQLNYRVKSSLSQNIARWKIMAFMEYSSIASTSGSGFSYHNVGVEIRYQLSERPVFYHRLARKFKIAD